ncbi:MBL fold metallo-hydrolase [Polyangium fumosum]|uniref:MBL fold metallo-hydrolase n=1 Tax=Polyangium fumosum TaxID=889272 RepID=UPI001E5DB5DB|nr:MBL fold metallo-hydrolase [Polyangium fumosum]
MRPESLFFRPDDLVLRGAAGRPPVTVRWLGTAGFEITCEDHVVLLDPYVTRASLTRCITSPLAPDLGAIGRYISRADAVIVGHTHFDHALDVPAIAKRTGARVFGSRSAAALCHAAGVPEARVDMVERAPGQTPIVRELGPFRLRFVPSAHSRFALGRVPFPGDIDDCDAVPVRAEGYRCGAVFRVEIEVAGRTIVHLGSAELLPDEPAPRHVDLLLLCVAGWRSGVDLPERVMRAVSPAAVLLSHWDDFFRPLHAPVRALPAVGLGPLAERLTRASRDVRVGALPLLGDLFL